MGDDGDSVDSATSIRVAESMMAIALSVSEDGDAWAQLEAEHDVRLTQRWYLQPRAEVVAAGSEVEKFGIAERLPPIKPIVTML